MQASDILVVFCFFSEVTKLIPKNEGSVQVHLTGYYQTEKESGPTCRLLLFFHYQE